MEAGPYGPSTEIFWRSIRGDDDNFWYKLCDQLPPLLMTTLSFSGSKLVLEVTVNGCHCSLEIAGTFKKTMLVGV